jgi:hypothetical protein
MALHVFVFVSLLVVCLLLSLELLWRLDRFALRPSSRGGVKRTRLQRLLKPRSPDDCPCAGYLWHPSAGEAFESTPFHRSLLADSSEEEYNLKPCICSSSPRGMDTVKGILTFITRLTELCLQSLHHRYVAWTKPETTSLLLGTLTDLARSKSELVAENALLRHQVIILRRQVKRPACTKTDRLLLVLLARIVSTWKQALFIVQPETLLRWHRQGFKLFWKYKSRAASLKPRISQETVALIQEMARDNRLWGAERIRGERALVEHSRF